MIHRLIVIITIMKACYGFDLMKGEYLLGGIQVNEPDHEVWVSALNHHQMNTVSVTVYASQERWNSAKLNFQQEDEGALAEIKAAKESNLRVVFIPRVSLDHQFPENAYLWHGMIMPRTDEELRLWFSQYREYLVKWAKVAEEHKVEVFGVGSELKALSHTAEQSEEVVQSEIDDFVHWFSLPVLEAGDGNEGSQKEYLSKHNKAYLSWAQEVYYTGDSERQVARVMKRRALLLELWRETIREVRSVYSGALTYAANFDTYHNNGLWSDLDIMGINAYFKLRHNPSVLTQAELDQSWKEIMSNIRAVREKQGVTDQPLIFTELGYTYKKYASIEPWSYEGVSVIESDEGRVLIDWQSQPTDYGEREMCLKALRATAHLPENSFFRGLLYWKLSTMKQHEKVESFMLHIAPDSKDGALEVLKGIFVRD